MIRMLYVRAVAAAIMTLTLSWLCLGQEPGGQQAPPPGQPPGGGQQGGGAGRQPGNQPTFPDRGIQQPVPEISRPIYLSGSVRLSDGSIPPVNVVIERVCNGVIRPEAYTDSKGNFNFMVGGQNSAVFADASVASPAIVGPGPQSGTNERSLTGCEIRANLPGFLSDSIILGFRGPLDDPEIGVIHLQRLANVEGYTFSITTALAPKDARRLYEKGVDSMKKKKWADAERDLSKSVQLYPKYAVAWYELGRSYQQQKKFDEANHAHLEAIKLDYKGAAESLQTYLKYSPNAKDADTVKQQLAEMEKALAEGR